MEPQKTSQKKGLGFRVLGFRFLRFRVLGFRDGYLEKLSASRL